MKTATMANRSVFLAGATATLAIAALTFTGSAKARDNVYWSVGVGAPGVSLSVGNAGPVYGYAQPVYFEPEPIYYQPRPVYVRPAPIYVQPLPVYYGRPNGWNQRHGRQHVQSPRSGYGAGYYDRSYAPVSQVVHQRDGRGDHRYDGRRDGRYEGRR
ncbi:MAG: hypothetical protein GZ093_16185 [Rhodoferax sp.]|uniref:hypothetical protein n=1 Tax=Rhodoferax sp. TaxID=50421 RepID=UPI0013FFA5FD|nr:hypothetical protein [Rhodoferax sp.]NDP40259.1 hypothetical protein [Rhodoferax sp.]